MAIKRKDGSVYRLQGPNPIMAGQSIWDDDVIIHNFVYEEQTTWGRTAEQEVKEVEQSKVETSLVKTNIVYCLPAEIIETYDMLYDEKRISISYGKKFTVEMIITERNDLKLTAWCNINIGKGSILYVPSDKRWWKINETSPHNGGIMVSCIPSDIQPSFD